LSDFAQLECPSLSQLGQLRPVPERTATVGEPLREDAAKRIILLVVAERQQLNPSVPSAPIS